MVFSTLLAIQHLHRRADGWNVGEGSDLPGDLRLVGRAAAPGSHHLGSGLLLGLHEGQPASPELHIEPTSNSAAPSSQPHQGRRKGGFKEKKEKHTKKRIFISVQLQKEKVLLLLLSPPL